MPLSMFESGIDILLDLLGTYGPKILIAILVIALGVYIANKSVKYLGRPVAKYLKRPPLIKPALQIIKYLIILLAILASLAVLGVELTGLFLSATVLSVIIGIVVAPIAANFISGAFLLSERPYDIGDMIYIPEIDRTGFVEDISISHTRITTLENTYLVVSNQRMRNRDVVNYTSGDIRIRRILSFEISYESDIEVAIKAAEESAEETRGVISKGGKISIMSTYYPLNPKAFVENFGESGIEISLMYWLKNPYYIKGMESKIYKKLFKKLKTENIEIPYPHRQLLFDKDSYQDVQEIPDNDKSKEV